jgi:uncharacterized protein (DUF433 family)
MISREPKTMLGKPVIAGTRVTVEAILEKMAGGMSVSAILEAYPHIENTDVTDALAFASMGSK